VRAEMSASLLARHVWTWIITFLDLPCHCRVGYVNRSLLTAAKCASSFPPSIAQLVRHRDSNGGYCHLSRGRPGPWCGSKVNLDWVSACDARPRSLTCTCSCPPRVDDLIGFLRSRSALSLTRLDLSETEIDCASVMDVLRDRAPLAAMVLDRNPTVTDACLVELTRFPLTSVSLKHCFKLTSRCVAVLATCTTLTSLNLFVPMQQVPLTDAQLDLWRRLPLTSLTLVAMRLTDAACATLACLPLVSLALWNPCAITLKGFTWLGRRLALTRFTIGYDITSACWAFIHSQHSLQELVCDQIGPSLDHDAELAALRKGVRVIRCN